MVLMLRGWLSPWRRSAWKNGLKACRFDDDGVAMQPVENVLRRVTEEHPLDPATRHGSHDNRICSQLLGEREQHLARAALMDVRAVRRDAVLFAEALDRFRVL